MIYDIKDLSDPLAGFLKDDPVRPHIPVNERFGQNRRVLAWTEDDAVKAMVCIKLCNAVPNSEQELLEDSGENPTAVIFYTIWSYAPRAGQKLLINSLRLIKDNFPNIQKFVTLSPQTEMAKRFHLNNGATVLRVNVDTVNYEYV